MTAEPIEYPHGALGERAVDASTAIVTHSGGRVLMGPKTIEHVGRFAMVSDLQGGCFSLIQMQQHGK
jgi:predicted enzyme related to lactoylglutathione lyase